MVGKFGGFIGILLTENVKKSPWGYQTKISRT